ncbi:hypothetical protein AB835_04985 [Candidatus Endobugula sertula]|uniref:Uncharacterized protein n=1 Tax=Candidatus Endobugula sertula TaxID=62101 RepID=A0A1D2QRL3_9GAMM|nr:hypothetical protein AB835_04985 [Candidatus Endobugula sertula]
MKIKFCFAWVFAVFMVLSPGYSAAGWLDKLSDAVKGNTDKSPDSLSTKYTGDVSLEEMNDAFKQALDIGSNKGG